MNDQTIKSIFNGKLAPPEGPFEGVEATRASSELREIEKKLRALLTPELAELLDEYSEATAKLNHYTVEAYYVDGFKTGAKLMMEILGGSDGDIAGILEKLPCCKQ